MAQSAQKTPYQQLLLDPRWQRRRLEVMGRNDFTCESCSDSESTLNVHHVRYQRGVKPWEYKDEELLCLCQPCHEERHDKTNVLLDMLAQTPAMCLNMDDAISWLAGYLASQSPWPDSEDVFRKFATNYSEWPADCQLFETGFLAATSMFGRRRKAMKAGKMPK